MAAQGAILQNHNNELVTCERLSLVKLHLCSCSIGSPPHYVPASAWLGEEHLHQCSRGHLTDHEPVGCLLWSRIPARLAAVAHPLTGWSPAGIEELREKREALQVQIQDEELEKSKIQQDLQASAAPALSAGRK